jgi:hypothetical protein
MLPQVRHADQERILDDELEAHPSTGEPDLSQVMTVPLLTVFAATVTASSREMRFNLPPRLGIGWRALPGLDALVKK